VSILDVAVLDSSSYQQEVKLVDQRDQTHSN